MTERLIAKLDRLGAEAGIKEMTPEIYRFAQLLNDDKLKQWDAWRAKRTWVNLTDEEIDYYIVHRLGNATKSNLAALIRLCEAKLKELNT